MSRNIADMYETIKGQTCGQKRFLGWILTCQPASKMWVEQSAIREDAFLYCKVWKGIGGGGHRGYVKGLEAVIKSAAPAADLIMASKSKQRSCPRSQNLKKGFPNHQKGFATTKSDITRQIRIQKSNLA